MEIWKRPKEFTVTPRCYIINDCTVLTRALCMLCRKNRNYHMTHIFCDNGPVDNNKCTVTTEICSKCRAVVLGLGYVLLPKRIKHNGWTFYYPEKELINNTDQHYGYITVPGL